MWPVRSPTPAFVKLCCCCCCTQQLMTSASAVLVLACNVLHRLAAAYNFDRPEAIDQAAFLDALTSLRVCTPLATACTPICRVRLA